jgi:hypothetical protein
MNRASFILIIAAHFVAGGLATAQEHRELIAAVSLTADGVVRIDQSRVLRGSVTPGDAPGFPVTISQPGSYRLAGNLTVPDLDTTAIQITADFVTLDLNGFSIVGPFVCTAGPATICPASGKGTGVQAGGDQPSVPRGVRVLNGSVRGMGLFGIQLPGDGSLVERVTVDSNAGGGMTVAGAVTQSAATRNGSFGIIADIVRDCFSSQNAGDGIILGVLGPNGGVASRNTSSSNGGVGIAVQLGTASVNTLFLNTGAGISALCPSSIVGNTIVTNGSANIETKGDSCTLANNATRP